MAARAGTPATRDELLNALFDARDDYSARSYLCQAIIGVRRRTAGSAAALIARFGQPTLLGRDASVVKGRSLEKPFLPIDFDRLTVVPRSAP